MPKVKKRTPIVQKKGGGQGNRVGGCLHVILGGKTDLKKNIGTMVGGKKKNEIKKKQEKKRTCQALNVNSGDPHRFTGGEQTARELPGHNAEKRKNGTNGGKKSRPRRKNPGALRQTLQKCQHQKITQPFPTKPRTRTHSRKGRKARGGSPFNPNRKISTEPARAGEKKGPSPGPWKKATYHRMLTRRAPPKWGKLRTTGTSQRGQCKELEGKWRKGGGSPKKGGPQ